MTGARAGPAEDAAAMPSWSSSHAGEEHAATTTPADSSASELESARKLLEQLFGDAPDDETPDDEAPAQLEQ